MGKEMGKEVASMPMYECDKDTKEHEASNENKSENADVEKFLRIWKKIKKEQNSRNRRLKGKRK